MAPFYESVKHNWRLFTPTERRNIVVYISGIMMYKFGLEAFNGSVVTLATNRYDYDAWINDTQPKTFQRVGLMVGLNQACQCVGSILIAPLIRRFPSRVVLAAAVLVFGLLSALLLIVDASTGGKFAPSSFRDRHPEHDFHYYGNYNTDGIIPVYCVAGIAYGMVELIRRVIPRDLVGGNVQKLRQVDALVHIFYEVAGTSGAFCTALALIPYFGNNYSFLITPVCFGLAAVGWFFLTDHGFQNRPTQVLGDQPPYIKAVVAGFWLFFESIWTGAGVLFSSRKFIWLLPGYSIALYAHRYLENSVAPAIARRYLGNAAWSQIIVGGSNLGELLGALFVILFTNTVATPIPWLRLDAILLLVTWYLPFWRPEQHRVSQAWIAAATFLPISFGWAAGDVSLAAYIQAALARVESRTRNVSALGAVMAFLYSTYIVIYAITSPILGSYIDHVYAETGGSEGNGNIFEAIQNVASVQFTVVSILVLVATFVPRGSTSLNPKMLHEEDLELESPGIAQLSSKEDVT
ncbi:major facilitator superfamily domain-containing protein [Aspergillus egyptiacus]|nr:major facilitator superfamily domain-containing protein [Aspergillus egyptiacus]